MQYTGRTFWSNNRNTKICVHPSVLPSNTPNIPEHLQSHSREAVLFLQPSHLPCTRMWLRRQRWHRRLKTERDEEPTCPFPQVSPVGLRHLQNALIGEVPKLLNFQLALPSARQEQCEKAAVKFTFLFFSVLFLSILSGKVLCGALCTLKQWFSAYPFK